MPLTLVQLPAAPPHWAWTQDYNGWPVLDAVELNRIPPVVQGSTEFDPEYARVLTLTVTSINAWVVAHNLPLVLHNSVSLRQQDANAIREHVDPNAEPLEYPRWCYPRIATRLAPQDRYPNRTPFVTPDNLIYLDSYCPACWMMGVSADLRVWNGEAFTQTCPACTFVCETDDCSNRVSQATSWCVNHCESCVACNGPVMHLDDAVSIDSGIYHVDSGQWCDSCDRFFTNGEVEYDYDHEMHYCNACADEAPRAEDVYYDEDGTCLGPLASRSSSQAPSWNGR